MMRTARILIFAVILLTGLGAEAAADTVAFIAGHPENSVSAVRVSDGSILRAAPVGREPRGIALSTDGRTLYVANSADGTVSVLSAADFRHIRDIPVLPGPTDVALSPGGEQLFVACRSSNSVAVIRTGDGAVIAAIPAGREPSGIAVAPDGRFLYVSNSLDDTISVIGVPGLIPETVIELGQGFRPSGIRLSPDGERIYAASFESRAIRIIDTRDHRTLSSVTSENPPMSFSFSQDGDYVFLWESPGTLTRVRASDSRIMEKVPVAGGTAPASHALALGLEASDAVIGGGGPAGGVVVSDIIAALTTPSNLYALPASLSQINLSWTDDSTDEIGYRIERRIEAGSFTEITTVGANVTYYSDTGLLPYTKYYYRVRAYNLTENSPYSNEAYTTTQPGDDDDDDNWFFCSVSSVLPGTPFGGHMKTLRDFRDGFLKKSAGGRAIVELYYRSSPALAKMLRQSSMLRLAALLFLVPVIYIILHPWLILLPPLALSALILLRSRMWRKREALVSGA